MNGLFESVYLFLVVFSALVWLHSSFFSFNNVICSYVYLNANFNSSPLVLSSVFNEFLGLLSSVSMAASITSCGSIGSSTFSTNLFN